MTTITVEQEASIREYLKERHIPTGIGTEEEACSIAAINLALSGKLTDDVPECMSEVIGRWVISAQDAMPDETRNSAEWKALLPLAAGTGRGHEAERRGVVMDWVWGTVLPSIQFVADEYGFGEAWSKMCKERTWDAADAAADAADAAADAADAAAAYAAADAEKRRLWAIFDPVNVLRQLVAVTDERALKIGV